MPMLLHAVSFTKTNCNVNTIMNFTLSCFSNEHGLNLYCFTQLNKCILCIYWSILGFAVSSSTDSLAKCVVWLALSTCSKLGAAASSSWLGSNAGSSRGSSYQHMRSFACTARFFVQSDGSCTQSNTDGKYLFCVRPFV